MIRCSSMHPWFFRGSQEIGAGHRQSSHSPTWRETTDLLKPQNLQSPSSGPFYNPADTLWFAVLLSLTRYALFRGAGWVMQRLLTLSCPDTPEHPARCPRCSGFSSGPHRGPGRLTGPLNPTWKRGELSSPSLSGEPLHHPLEIGEKKKIIRIFKSVYHTTSFSH